MLGDLPPHSSATDFMFEAPAYPRIRRPTAPEPVNVSASTSLWSASALPGGSPKPGTKLTTPSGIPVSATSAARRRFTSGAFSEGLITIELPAASAGASFQQVSTSGYLHGTIAPTTPTGSRVT